MVERHGCQEAKNAKGTSKNRRCFILVHLSSIGSYAWQGGDTEELISEWVMASKDADCVIVIDQGWDGRWENRARREIAEAVKPKPHAWVEHDESSEDSAVASWDRMEDELADILIQMAPDSVTVGGLWAEDCVAETVRRLSAHRFPVAIDVDSVRGFDDIEVENESDEEE